MRYPILTTTVLLALITPAAAAPSDAHQQRVQAEARAQKAQHEKKELAIQNASEKLKRDKATYAAKVAHEKSIASEEHEQRRQHEAKMQAIQHAAKHAKYPSH